MISPWLDASNLLVFFTCITIPVLGYFGVLFTYAHQNSDFRELLAIEQFRRLPGFMPFAKQITDPVKAARQSNSLVFLDGEVGQIVRNQIARHSLSECFGALIVMGLAFGLIGFFVCLPVQRITLEMSAYGLWPFPSAGPAAARIDEAAYARSMTALFWAYIGAFAYAFKALTDRLNSRDATPGHFYMLTGRLILACCAATLVHHANFGIGVGATDKLLPALYFFCGVFPQRILDWVWHKVSEQFSLETPKETTPPLTEVTGLTEQHIQRLAEIGIDSAHALALADPIRSFVRLPYRLSQLIDWVSQSLLFWAFGTDGGNKLRAAGIFNILETGEIFFEKEDLGTKFLADVLGMNADALEAKWEAIENSQPYIRLKELADALAEHERDKAAPNPNG